MVSRNWHLLCWLFGHKWVETETIKYSHDTETSTYECTRCGERQCSTTFSMNIIIEKDKLPLDKC